ncbi:MAG: hypothetical protein JWO53_311 [Chlamydiia bacterium]|nr:hypothetical protein [Chlamydiia bacterium]
MTQKGDQVLAIDGVAQAVLVGQKQVPDKILRCQKALREFLALTHLTYGDAVDNGDCFYDALAQGLTTLFKRKSNPFTVKELRALVVQEAHQEGEHLRLGTEDLHELLTIGEKSYRELELLRAYDEQIEKETLAEKATQCLSREDATSFQLLGLEHKTHQELESISHIPIVKTVQRFRELKLEEKDEEELTALIENGFINIVFTYQKLQNFKRQLAFEKKQKLQRLREQGDERARSILEIQERRGETIPDPLWGRLEIEGKLIAQRLGVKIALCEVFYEEHVISTKEFEERFNQKFIASSDVYDSEVNLTYHATSKVTDAINISTVLKPKWREVVPATGTNWSEVRMALYPGHFVPVDRIS